MQDKTVIHYTRDYLDQTTTWIYGQIKFNCEYQPVIFADRVKNLEQFPSTNLYGLTKDLSKWQYKKNKLVHRVTGNYPYFLKAAGNHTPRLIHAHFGNIGYKAIPLSKKLNIPLITTFYGYEASALAKKEKYQKRFKILFEKGTLVLAEGNHLRNELIRLGCPPEKSKVFHLGVEVENYPLRKRVVDASQPLRILFAASFVEKKGAKYALLAFAEAKKKYPNIKLKLIGDGPERANVLDLANKLNITNDLEWQGYIKYSDFVNEIYKADIFIQPSITAADGNTEGGSPVSLIDAQATGIPVLSTFHADIPEVVLHNKTGLLAPEKDYQTLGDNLLKLLENPDLLVDYGMAGRLHVEENYNIRKQGKILSEIYDSTWK
jgi:colanic acid/amylovoran biosynthesis glycosyltransferase